MKKISGFNMCNNAPTSDEDYNIVTYEDIEICVISGKDEITHLNEEKYESDIGVAIKLNDERRTIVCIDQSDITDFIHKMYSAEKALDVASISRSLNQVKEIIMSLEDLECTGEYRKNLENSMVRLTLGALEELKEFMKSYFFDSRRNK